MKQLKINKHNAKLMINRRLKIIIKNIDFCPYLYALRRKICASKIFSYFYVLWQGKCQEQIKFALGKKQQPQIVMEQGVRVWTNRESMFRKMCRIFSLTEPLLTS